MNNPFKRSYSSQELEVFEFLEKVGLFKNLTHREMSLFLPYMHERDFKAKEVVFFRGDPSQALYIVRKGRVCLNLDIKDRFETLTEIRSQQAFGDNSLLSGTNRIYSAFVTTEQAELYVIPQVNIMEIFENEAEVKAKMLQSLAETYNYYTIKLFEAYKSSFGFFDLSLVYQEETDN